MTANIVNSVRLSKFVNAIRVRFTGGAGGNGCISMLHEFANEFGGPDGGNGGNGGHVVLRANRQVKSLGAVKSAYRGAKGEPGQGKNMYGRDADHLVVDVPVGTFVIPTWPKDLAPHERDPDKSEVIADLDQDGSMFIAARGGAGGRGNASYLSNTNRHPRVAQAGAKGEDNTYELRMRMYAHVGLIGLPNVGKSSMLRTLTSAKVKIGDYSFTTLYPQVGVLEYADYTQIAVSDLPGLIEDSHKNRGLGVEFLKSLKLCACLLYIVDLTDNPIRQLEILFYELEMHNKNLRKRPCFIFGNKIDDPRASESIAPLTEFLAKHVPGTRLIVGSTSRGDNLEEVRLEIRKLYDQYRAQHPDDIDDCLVW